MVLVVPVARIGFPPAAGWSLSLRQPLTPIDIGKTARHSLTHSYIAAGLGRGVDCSLLESVVLPPVLWTGDRGRYSWVSLLYSGHQYSWLVLLTGERGRPVSPPDG